jgi:hypothetical protein
VSRPAAGSVGAARALVVLALLGCVGLFALLRTLSATPFVDATWRTNAKGQWCSTAPATRRCSSSSAKPCSAWSRPTSAATAEVLLSRRSPRWVLDDVGRRHQLADGAAFARVVQQGAVRLRLAESGAIAEVRTVPRGYAGLGSLFWLMTALALVFY